MLNVPNSVKTLYKTDGVHKNFRVHFPNGELNDITNDDVVRESLHFTESLCSQDVFKFGLAEASVLEFETVGIGNMYGMTIEASIEIDTSSLSAAEITTIQAGTWDGTLVLAQDSDIGYGYFRVPLGIFRVESCPRNHGAMTHRKVTAYTMTANDFQLSPIEQVKEDLMTSFPKGTYFLRNGNYYFDLESFLFANIGYYRPNILTGTYTKTLVYELTSPTSGTRSMTAGGYDRSDSSLVQIYLSLSYSAGSNDIVLNTDQNIYGIDFGSIDYSDFDDILADLRTRYVSSNGTDIFFGWNKSYLYPNLRLLADRFFPPIKSGENIYYPTWRPGSSAQYISVYFFTALSGTFTVVKNGTTIETHTFSIAADSNPKMYEYTPAVARNSTIIGVPAPEGGVIVQEDLSKYAEGFFEMQGAFFDPLRNGGYGMTVLDPSSPLAVNPGDYMEAWWDEYNVSPIGTVVAPYVDSNGNDSTATIGIGGGVSYYDMSSNEVIKGLSAATLEDVTTLLQGDFAANAANVGFTPIDLQMRGWPWLEAGDALEITAEDGTVVDTYALRVEMSGIQNLQMAITAQGGQIIGEA